MALTGVTRPAHAQIRVLDMAKAVHHYGTILGLIETGRDAQGRVYFKAWDERDLFCLVLREADTAGIDHFAFRVLDKASLDQFEIDLEKYGVPVQRIPAGELLGTGERIRFTAPTGHVFDLFAEKEHRVEAERLLNPSPWTHEAERGIAPVRMDHALLYGTDLDGTVELFTKVLGFRLSEAAYAEDGTTMAVAFLSCSNKCHDIAFGRFPEPGKLHHVSYRMESWEKVLRAGDIMGMNHVPIDIGPTRHGITRGCTIYAWDPSGNRFETFSGSYDPYPDWEPIRWTIDDLGRGLDYPQQKLHETFLTVVT